ncbi:MAG: ribonuclease T [Pontixanthobacter sp.]
MRTLARLVGLLGPLFVLLALPAPAIAQAYQCRMPKTVTVPKVMPRARPRRLPVTGYTLAASWSPEFCKGRGRDGRHATQCSGRNGRFAFIAHGLWPESRGSWPQYCATRRAVTPAVARPNMCMMPSARLLATQWVKHGSCMTRLPRTYFRITRILWNSITFPDADYLSRDEALTAGMLRDAFVERNPAWPRQAVGLDINRRGWLREMRLCYGRDFLPKPCDARRFGPKDNQRIEIWRGL